MSFAGHEGCAAVCGGLKDRLAELCVQCFQKVTAYYSAQSLEGGGGGGGIAIAKDRSKVTFIQALVPEPGFQAWCAKSFPAASCIIKKQLLSRWCSTEEKPAQSTPLIQSSYPTDISGNARSYRVDLNHHRRGGVRRSAARCLRVVSHAS